MNTAISLTGLKSGDRIEFLPVHFSTIKLSIIRNRELLSRRDGQKDWIFLQKLDLHAMTLMADIISEISGLKARLIERDIKAGHDFAVFLLEN